MFFERICQNQKEELVQQKDQHMKDYQKALKNKDIKLQKLETEIVQKLHEVNYL